MKFLFVQIITACVALAGQTPIGSEGNAPAADRNIDEIRDILASVGTSVQEAYAALLSTEPEASGEINARFAITPDGSVTDIEITCTEGLETLIDHVSETVASLDFGSCPGQTENLPVSFPLSLIPPRQETD